MATSETVFINNALLFTRLLRRAGLPVSPDQAMEFLKALNLVDIGNREQVYYAARAMLVTRPEQLRLFQVIFNRFWDAHGQKSAPRGQKMPLAPRHRPTTGEPFNVATYMAYLARQSDPEVDITDKSGSFSPGELLQRKEFSQMTPEELDSIKRLIQEMRWKVSLRRTRRRVPERKGEQLHLRRVMRLAMGSGGAPVRLAWQRRKVKERPIVLIADISGSMEKYARLLLQFFYSVSHTFREVECFVFGTRLTRITTQLRLKNIDRAVEEAARDVVDWSGGTRIGETLSLFNRRWGRRVLRRGAVVLIISDGWERGDTSELQREMRFLQHRSHRLIWLNPLLGKEGYQPLAEGMAAALPHIDDFLPIHNLQSLHELSTHLGALS